MLLTNVLASQKCQSSGIKSLGLIKHTDMTSIFEQEKVNMPKLLA